MRLLIWGASFAMGLAAVALAGWIARTARAARMDRVQRAVAAALNSRWAPLVAGLATAGIVWWCWGSLNQVPVYDDERAYVLQARIFARGRWTAPVPPEPAFFQQLHVLDAPAVAAKYPPGHALALVPGIWLGLPGLMPLCLSLVAGALVFALARRLGGPASGPWIALLTWLISITQPAAIQWRATYLSETTTAALWLAGWWCVLRWRRSRQPRMLALLGAVVGYGAITRPLTMLAFAVPVSVVVARDIMGGRFMSARLWSERLTSLIVGLGPCFAMLALVPLWSANTTGNWRVTPVASYTRDFLPWDHLGFGYDSTPPTRALPPDLQSTANDFIGLNRRHTLATLPRIAVERAVTLIGEFGRGWRRVLILFAIVGLMGLSAEGWIAVVTAGLLFVFHLGYVHFTSWTVYYLEMWPVPAFLAARGVWATLVRIAPSRAGLAALILALVALAPAGLALNDVREERASRTLPGERFRAGVAALAGVRVLIFVRYAPNHQAYAGLVGHVADPSTARAWVAYDLGDRDTALIVQARDRVPYRYDEELGTFSRLPSPLSSRLP
jgi:4-amino-4-deoxy-L-arabinose transferase-like glycosyltransferase